MTEQSNFSVATVMIFSHNIGIDINSEESLFFIAKDALTNLPDNWEVSVAEDGEENEGIPYFYNLLTGESVWEHPNHNELQIRVKNTREEYKFTKKMKSPKKSRKDSDKNQSAKKYPSADNMDNTTNVVFNDTIQSQTISDDSTLVIHPIGNTTTQEGSTYLESPPVKSLNTETIKESSSSIKEAGPTITVQSNDREISVQRGISKHNEKNQMSKLAITQNNLAEGNIY